MKENLQIKTLTFIFLIFGVNLQAQFDTGAGLNFTDPGLLAGIPIAHTPFSGQELPSKKDLSINMPPPGNQGRQNSCVGWSVAYAIKSYQEKVEENKPYKVNGQINNAAIFSPAFIYNQVNNGQDGGSYFVDALNLVSQKGAVQLNVMPYDAGDYLTKPSAEQKEKAKPYKIDFWRKVNVYDQKEVKAQLNAGYPVMIGAMIDEGLIRDGYKGLNPYIWKGQVGKPKGGHAMVVVGYDDALNAFKIMNSWGTRWGNGGFFWLDYSFFPKVVREGYVMKDALNAPPEPSYVDNTRRPVKPFRDVPSNKDGAKDLMEDMLPDENPAIPPSKQANTLGNSFSTTFVVDKVEHNVKDRSYGESMHVVGRLNLPKNVGRNYQIVVQYYYLDGYDDDGNPKIGTPIKSISTLFMMPDGTAASGTPILDIDYSVTDDMFEWYASMPYKFLRVPRGQHGRDGKFKYKTTDIVAIPTLYVDNFALQQCEAIAFYVSM